MDDPHNFTVSLLTLGDPGRLTGGYLYHRRMAALAPRFGARIQFVSLPDWPFPLPALAGRRVLRAADRGCDGGGGGSGSGAGSGSGSGADVVLLDSIAAAFVAPWLGRLRAPLVAILHQPPGGIDHGRLRRSVQAAADRRAYRFARRLLVASEALADGLRRAGYPPDLLTVIPPGRDVAAAGTTGSTATGTGAGPGAGTEAGPGAGTEAGQGAGAMAGGAVGDLRTGRRAALLSVGNWVARKGLLDVLEAVARLPADAVTLHLVGSPDEDPAYAARVRRRLAAPDLAGRVVVHGPQPVDRVAALYRAADAFVLASRREPYGTVYGEAMAAGLPVVGWAVGNLPYLARDGEEGLVVPPGDVVALAGALRRLAYDEAFRARLGAAAGRRAESFPTWEDSAAALFHELRMVAAAGHGSGKASP